jgi:O-succinylbenzoate synthase
MLLTAEKHLLQFIKPAKTSRGEYAEKEVLLLELREGPNYYQAEVAPLPDLSIDGKLDLFELVSPFLEKSYTEDSLMELLEFCDPYPTLRFGIYALLQKVRAQNNLWTNTAFNRKESGLEINGLVWMNDIESMFTEAENKVNEGFRCIKFKVGALDFDSECRMLEAFRKKHKAFNVEIRLDANGAFPEDIALSLLKDLSRFEIHSIEQPIPAGLPDGMARLCRESAIDIALDEELIGVPVDKARFLLHQLKPQYIILKPTLIGGFDRCDAWIKAASLENIGWWSTSALEGNIGLFDIAQWVSSYPVSMPQGLGTGALFVKNFPQNTSVKQGYLHRI